MVCAWHSKTGQINFEPANPSNCDVVLLETNLASTRNVLRDTDEKEATPTGTKKLTCKAVFGQLQHK